jgi:hypothetical protein
MKEQPETHTTGSRPARPFAVTLLAILVLSITVLALIRFFGALSSWDFLAQLPGVSPLYLAITGLVGAIVGIPLSLGLLTGRPFALRATRAAALLFVVYNWLERWWLSTRNEEPSLTPFQAGLALACLAVVFWVCSRPETRAYVGEKHE